MKKFFKRVNKFKCLFAFLGVIVFVGMFTTTVFASTITASSAAMPAPSGAPAVSTWSTGSTDFADEVIDILMSTSGTGSLIWDFTDKTNPLVPLAMSLVALYFVIEVINKSTSMDKVTIEMIVKMLLKLLIAKILVQEAAHVLLRLDAIILNTTQGIYDEIDGITLTSALTLDVGDMLNQMGFDGVRQAFNDLTVIYGAITTGLSIAKGAGLPAAFIAIAEAAIAITINAVFPDIWIPTGSGVLGLWFVLIAANLIITAIVTVVCKIQIYITILLRSFELVILATLSPLAMAAFVSDEFKAQTKKFILQFIAISVQAIVIVVICGLMKNLWSAAAYDDWVRLGIKSASGTETWGLLQPVMAMLRNIAYPIMVSMMVGKSRQIAQSILGS